MARINYALRVLKDRFDSQRSHCPYCDSVFHQFLQRKWLLIQARQCVHCGLIYRWPTDDPERSREFYENQYQGQQATDLPNAKVLAELVSSKFINSQYDKTNRADFIKKTVGTQGRFLDYGCSWGYSVYQYGNIGFKASGFELDRNRAQYGVDQLSLDIRSRQSDFVKEGEFDVIYSDHSFEHVPDPSAVLNFWSQVSSTTAKLIIFVPSGNGKPARENGMKWLPLLGEAHTLAFTMEWFTKNLPRHGWMPKFYTPAGDELAVNEYLDDEWEISMVATKM